MERERERNRRARVTYKLAARYQLHSSPAMFRHSKLAAVSKSLVDRCRYCNRRFLRISAQLRRNLNFADNLLPPLIRVILEERLRGCVLLIDQNRNGVWMTENRHGILNSDK